MGSIESVSVMFAVISLLWPNANIRLCSISTYRSSVKKWTWRGILLAILFFLRFFFCFWLLAFGFFWLLAFGFFWLLASGFFWLLASGFELLASAAFSLAAILHEFSSLFAWICCICYISCFHFVHEFLYFCMDVMQFYISTFLCMNYLHFFQPGFVASVAFVDVFFWFYHSLLVYLYVYLSLQSIKPNLIYTN